MKLIYYICYDGLILFYIDFVLFWYYFLDIFVLFKEKCSVKKLYMCIYYKQKFYIILKKKCLNEKNGVFQKLIWLKENKFDLKEFNDK